MSFSDARSGVRIADVSLATDHRLALKCRRFDIDVEFRGGLFTSTRRRQQMQRRLHELFVRRDAVTGARVAQGANTVRIV